MGIIKNFKYALIGLWYILRHERTARLHIVAAIASLSLGLVLQVSNTELAAIFFAIILVFLAEILNTAIEKMLDLVHPDQSPRVALIKDMAAGAVLVTSLGAALMGGVIFLPYILGLLWAK